MEVDGFTSSNDDVNLLDIIGELAVDAHGCSSSERKMRLEGEVLKRG